MKFCSILLLLFVSFFSFGQNQQKIDSLLTVVSKAENDTIKARTLYKISRLCTSFDASKKFSDSAYAISKRIGFPLGMIYNSVNSAYIEQIRGKHKESILRLKEAKRDIKRINKSVDEKEALKIDRWIALGYSKMHQYDSAMVYVDYAIKTSKRIHYNEGLIAAYLEYGNIYSEKNELSNAIIYYLKVDSLCIKNHFYGSQYAAANGNLGLIKASFFKYDEAIQYYDKAKQAFDKMKNVGGSMSVTDAIGVLELKRKNPKEAITYLETSLVFFTKRGYTSKRIQTLGYLGAAYRQTKEYDNAERMLKEQLALSLEKKDSVILANSHTELGLLYNDKKQYNTSIKHFKEAKEIGKKKKNYLLVKRAVKGLSDAYFNNLNYKASITAYKEYVAVADSLNSQRNRKEAQLLETKYAATQKEQEIKLLKSENEIIAQQKSNQRNILLGGVGISSLAGLFFFFLYKNRQKTTKKLQELDKAKSNFFANISHEFRTPLTLISGPIQKQLKKDNLPVDERNDFEMMQRNSNRLLALVDQLLDVSKIEAGNLKLKISKGQVIPFLGSLTDSFTYAAKQKNIQYKVTSKPTEAPTYFDKDALEKILVNLLSNAIKYTPNKGTIICDIAVKNKQLHIEVKNTGKGLSKEQRSNIFKRFYQIDENTQGVGIGLSLVKELVMLHKGKIAVESKLNEWTIFNVEIPMAREFFTNTEFSKSTITVEESTHNLENNLRNQEGTLEEKGKDEKPIVLIVDDNTDVRFYVSSLFKNDYKVLTAKEGQEGIDIAIEHIPDIIICDIMMPVKNGIELCTTLKADERTSHIPIILLTAKAGEEHEIEGIKTGADDYITKPFSEDLVRLRVEKLIENRKKLQERYSQEVILRPKDVAISSIDEQFLERLQKVLDKNLLESSFKIEDFSKAVGMSRMQLHRKLKALTGLSATEFIRSQRLKLAAQLLKKSEINVSQVGYSVGFNDHAYFSKCFKEAYHCTPTEYAAKK